MSHAHWGWFVTALCGVALCAGEVDAQTVDRKWEVEFHAGGLFSSAPDGGTGTLPPPGIVQATIPPFTSYYVSSWFFGSGAEQLNAYLTSARLNMLNVSMIPLDDILQSRLADYGSGGSFGARISRQLTRRLVAEFTIDMGFSEAAVTTRALGAIETSRQTFASTWNAILQGPSRSTQTVASVTAVDKDGGRPLIASGALLISVLPRGRVTPFVAVGGGVVTARGEGPSAELEGTYEFTLLLPPSFIPPVPFPPFVVNDRDAVVIRSVMETKAAFLFGGGMKYELNDRLGLRIDLRDNVSGDAQRTELAATPSTEPAPNTLTLIGPPPIVFGSNLFIHSTLSGPAVTDFETFRGDGIVHRVNLGAGLYWRF